MTPEQTLAAAKLMTEWAQSVIDGKPIKIESLTSLGWKEIYPVWCWGSTEYRLKPQPKRVPLEAKDVPPGSVIRHNNWLPTSWRIVGEIDMVGVWGALTGKFKQVTWQQLFDNWQISRDNGKTWEPCSKLQAD